MRTTPWPSSMRYGARGPAVTQLQQRLKKAGYYHGDVDAKFGPATRAAVRQFQAQHGIPSNTGTVGPKTRAALARYTDAFEAAPRQLVQLHPSNVQSFAARPLGQTASQPGLDRIKQARLHTGPAHTCVATVRRNLRAAGFQGLPAATGRDRNNPRGMMSQMLQSGHWTSLDVPGSKQQTIHSPYGNVQARVLTGEAYRRAAANGQIPEGAVVFQANRPWNLANDRSRGSDVGIVRNGGIFNYKQFPRMTVYGNVAEVVVLLPK